MYGGDKEGIDSKGPNRRGRIHHNYVHHQPTCGLYVDAWSDLMSDIELDHNVLHNCGGLTVTSEVDEPVRDISVHHNLVFRGWTVGLHVWNETVDGEPMPNSMIAELVQAGEDFEMVVVNEFDCEDGSGSIVVAERHRVDASDPGYAGEPGSTVGTWVVRSGSIDGAPVGGSGDTISGGDIQVSGEQSWLAGSLTTG